MRDLQSSIAAVTSTVETALKRQSDEGLLPNLIATLQAIQTTTMTSRNGVKKQLHAFDQRIVGLSTNISALKEELATRGERLDKETTVVQSRPEVSNISTLMEEVSAQGVKLDKAITIIEAQQEMIRALLNLMQKGSVELKGGIVKLHSHFDGVAERIAFVDHAISSGSASTTPRPPNYSGQSLHTLPLTDPPMDVDLSTFEPHSMSDALPLVTSPLVMQTPAILPNDGTNLVGDRSNTPAAEATAMIVDTSADSIAITTATVEDSLSADVRRIAISALHQSSSLDPVGQLMTATAKGTSVDGVPDITVIPNLSPNTLDTPEAGSVRVSSVSDDDMGVASETNDRNAEANVNPDVAPRVLVATSAADGSNVEEKVTPDAAPRDVESEASNTKHNVDQDVAHPAVGE